MVENGGLGWVGALLNAVLLSSVLQVHAQSLAIQVVDPSGKGLGGVVLVAQTKTPERLLGPAQSEIRQRNLEFIPNVLVVQAGAEVAFPNEDRVMHHVYSFSDAKTFELPLYQSIVPPPVAFDRSGVAVIGCNIHDHMLAHVLVVETPYFGTTDTSGWILLDIGTTEISSLVAWHPSWGEFGAEQRALDGRKELIWKVAHRAAGTPKRGVLAWNEDY